MFYDNFKAWCTKKGETPTWVGENVLGISSAAVAQWKKRGTTPKYDTLQKIAEHFGITVDTLLGEYPPEPKASPPPVKPDTVGTPVVKKGYSPPGTFGAGISPEEVEELSEGFSPVQKELFRTVLALDNKDAAKAIQLIQLILERDNGGK